MYKKALENLQAVLAENQIDTKVELINVDSPDKAEIFSFYGSPSIRVNGIDLEGKNDEFSYTCRIYKINGQILGAPTKKYIQERLNALGVI